MELRHQRTSDVVFDLANDGIFFQLNINQLKFSEEIKWKINEYVYKMIETLLPKAHYETNNTNNENDSKFKMMEMFIKFF